MILLDTNVNSELVRMEPNPSVIVNVGNLAPQAVFTAAVCEAEIRYGLARMPVGRRRDDLIARITTLFETGFEDLVPPFDRRCALVYAEIRQAREAVGKPLAVEVAMIAATARAYRRSLRVTPRISATVASRWLIRGWRLRQAASIHL